MKLCTLAGTWGNLTGAWFKRTQWSFVWLCWHLPAWWGDPLHKPLSSQVHRSQCCLPSFCYSLSPDSYSPLAFLCGTLMPLNPHLCQSSHPTMHPLDKQGLCSAYRSGHTTSYGRRGAGPQMELDCEKSRGSRVTWTGLQPHPLLALRSRASDLSSLSCSFLAVFADTDVCFRRFLWGSES